MITAHVSSKPLHEHPVEAYCILLPEDYTFEESLQEIARRWYPALETWMKKFRFKGSVHDQITVSGAEGPNPITLIFCGVGSRTAPRHERIEHLRRAVGAAIRIAERAKAKSLLLQTPSVDFYEVDGYVLAREIVTTLEMATYHFDQYITDETRKHPTDYTVTLWAPDRLHESYKVGIEHGSHIGYAVNQARHWCDLPASTMTPTHMAEHAARIASSHGLTAKIFRKSEIYDMGMGGLYAVGKGSAEECRLVALEYHPDTTEQRPTVALVGKGVTFDTGGLSIKPAARMDEMKDDMAGAAAVISTMELIAHLKPNVHVIGIAPLAENMPSGTAVRPGDIVQFYNGLTAEIKNTDAEGRLILADALAYAVKHYNIDALVTIATLTGACSAALGPFYCGLMSAHDALTERIIAASTTSGDKAWRMPFHDDYKPSVRSTVADLCNDSNATYRAGSTTAAFFLQRFTGNIPWVHLDIAGTAFNVPDRSYFRPGATGFGVRLFAELLLNWKQEK